MHCELRTDTALFRFTGEFSLIKSLSDLISQKFWLIKLLSQNWKTDFAFLFIFVYHNNWTKQMTEEMTKAKKWPNVLSGTLKSLLTRSNIATVHSTQLQNIVTAIPSSIHYISNACTWKIIKMIPEADNNFIWAENCLISRQQ